MKNWKAARLDGWNLIYHVQEKNQSELPKLDRRD